MSIVEDLKTVKGTLAIIGCGNLNRSDDGLGVIVAHRLTQWLKGDPHEHVKVFDAGTGGMDVMFQARGAASLILVDASISGSQPGSIFKLPGEEVIHQPVPGYNLHDFRWNHALYAARRVFSDTFPGDVTVYLVEAADVSLGLDLSPVVARAVERLVDRLKDEIRARSHGRSIEADSSPIHHGQFEEMDKRLEIAIRRGSIYIDAPVYSMYFSGLESLVLVRKDEKLLLLPIRHTAAGGLLMKVRNQHGDRVVHAQEFLRAHGIGEEREWTGPVQWDDQTAALVCEWPATP